MEYTFTLKFQLSDDNWDHDDLVELLFAAGCGEASIGAGRPGYIALEFTRRDRSKIAALESARADVMTAIPTALLID